MVGLVERWQRMGRSALLACGVVACVAGFSGCTSTSSGGTSAAQGGGAVFTPSDEPEARRRARIRLELATNYFENGQTTVALDEVKQALVADPTYADAFSLRGLIYLRLNEFGQAEESFRRALGLRGNDPNLLHNLGWLHCQQRKYAEADQSFVTALANPAYTARGKTLMARGLCQVEAGQVAEAEQSLLKAYELDASNPVVGYHLSNLLMRRNELTRAQFYIRRLNNSDFANAETLWLGIKVEHGLGDTVALRQLGDQLRRRFPDARETGAYQRGAFNE
ncbi:type IV pilus biogenesis/stability protein PilW [Acidovorax sp. CF316]|uniref:type IV pilus biogenesis/stability protein PilW n=1 Tax=Acidovorax sp. CF316 TaxID=1144317 RepID=UPI00026BBE2B|nr:type IV pilus biogenesis/stability protein PilW [Acidovorax sp. CF316]EJE54645.1 type IV pilus biogenesis/stability protein PilW [Acidovorax sp. CF316]